MTLSAMRQALQAGTENTNPRDPETASSTSNMEQEPQRKNSRLPPDSRGVKETRSSLIEVDLSAPPNTPSQKSRRGTLTFANSVRELKRAGSSRVVDGGGGGGGGLLGDDSSPSSSPTPPMQRSPPRRAQSCMQG